MLYKVFCILANQLKYQHLISYVFLAHKVVFELLNLVLKISDIKIQIRPKFGIVNSISMH